MMCHCSKEMVDILPCNLLNILHVEYDHSYFKMKANKCVDTMVYNGP